MDLGVTCADWMSIRNGLHLATLEFDSSLFTACNSLLVFDFGLQHCVMCGVHVPCVFCHLLQILVGLALGTH